MTVILAWVGYIIAALLVLLLIALFCVYIADKTQTKSTLRRNYPVLAHGRYFLEYLGTFLRQYFFALDREELPFNRAERSWVYRASKNISSTQAFGSTRDLRKPGTVYFLNSSFPTLPEERAAAAPVLFGVSSCAAPYETERFFHISAMSYGSLSAPAVQALSLGAAKAGMWLNTGEGGVSPHHLAGANADIIFQIGTGNFGVRAADGSMDYDRLKEVSANPQIKMLELKLAQGAKPGKGGILPATKVTPEIAEIRGIPEGEAALSPNRHIDAPDTKRLLQKLEKMREISGKPVGIKIVLNGPALLQELAAYVEEGLSPPDFITIDSADGGTGAAPMSLMDNVGMPVRETLPLAHVLLTELGLRDRVKLIASGKLIHPVDVAWALAAGADCVNSARGFMFALGCIQALHCNKNTCPTGITTHDPKLQRGLVPESKAERVAHYANNMEKEVQSIAHACGVNHAGELSPEHMRVILDHGRSIAYTEWLEMHKGAVA